MVALGGQVFEEPDDYVRDLAGRLFSAGPEDMSDLAQRVRFLRNPALLGEVGPRPRRTSCSTPYLAWTATSLRARLKPCPPRRPRVKPSAPTGTRPR